MRVRERTSPESAAPTKERRAATIEYTHLPLGEDVIAFAGYYTPEKEARLNFRGREVLYVTGHIVVESACHGDTCATGSYWYAIVPGYVVKWQHRQNDAGLPITEVVPIADRETQKEIERIIQDSEAVSRVDFR